MGSIQTRTARLTRGNMSTESYSKSSGPPGTSSTESPLRVTQPLASCSHLSSPTEPPSGKARRTPEDFGQLYVGSDLPEVTINTVEVERPTWVAVVQLTQLLSPDLARDLQLALCVGQYPLRGLALSQDATEALYRMITLIWGDSTLVVPMVKFVPFSVDEYGLPCPGKVYEMISITPHLPVFVQRIEVSTCSPLEKRILNVKQSFTSATSSQVVEQGIRLAMGDNTLMRSPAPPIPKSSSQVSEVTVREPRFAWVRRHL